jgi:RNA-splicing ligase RtcB
MAAAANFAWVNRSSMTFLSRQVLMKHAFIWPYFLTCYILKQEQKEKLRWSTYFFQMYF